MHQYTYTLTRIDGRTDQARCTARTAEIARRQIVMAYAPLYTVAATPLTIDAPHRTLGEIDASNEKGLPC